MPLVNLPIEIYGIIAEILAGDQAFGSLANLNLVNHAIREETLPILFETLLFDDHVTLGQWMKKRSHVPAGFQYVKFFIAGTGSSLGDAYDWLHLLPNLTLTVSLGSPPPGLTNFDYYIRLHKPLKPITIFGYITKTRLSPRLLQDLAKAPTTVHPLSGKFSPPSASRRLARFVLEHGAYLITETPAPINAEDWMTDVRLEDSYFREDAGPPLSITGEDPPIANDDQIADTICELLKLTIRRCPTVNVKEGRQLGILHTRTVVDKFFDKIPSLLGAYPRLLTHAIHLYVQAEYTKDELTDIIHHIQTILEQPNFFKQSNAVSDLPSRRAVLVLEKEVVEVAPPDLQVEHIYTYWKVALWMTVEGSQFSFSVESRHTSDGGIQR